MVVLSFNNLRKIATQKSIEITGVLRILTVRNDTLYPCS